MLYGVLDVGTNTVHGAVYQVYDRQIKCINASLLPSPVLEYIDNNALTQTGIRVLTSTIAKLLDWFREQSAESICVFSTASLRDLANGEAVRAEIQKNLQTDIQILSGEEEAECDFLAMQSLVDAEEGGCFDLGGGSIQVVSFCGNKPQFLVSLPLGTNRYWKQYVRGDEPTGEELETMYQAAYTIFSTLPAISTETLYAMGGTAKRICKIMSAIQNNPTPVIQKTDMQMLLDISASWKSIAKERYQTVMSGIVIISALCDCLQTDKIQVLSCGVRDGYIRKVVKKRE